MAMCPSEGQKTWLLVLDNIFLNEFITKIQNVVFINWTLPFTLSLNKIMHLVHVSNTILISNISNLFVGLYIWDCFMF